MALETYISDYKVSYTIEISQSNRNKSRLRVWCFEVTIVNQKQTVLYTKYQVCERNKPASPSPMMYSTRTVWSKRIGGRKPYVPQDVKDALKKALEIECVKSERFNLFNKKEQVKEGTPQYQCRSGMKKREFKARIVENFKERWFEWNARAEKMTIDQSKEYYGGKAMDELHNRISGKVVTIIEHEYPSVANEFFEKEDNNFVLSEELFQVL